MCTVYILASFVIGLFVGWLISYALTRHFFEDAFEEIAKSEAKQTISSAPKAAVQQPLAARPTSIVRPVEKIQKIPESFLSKQRVYNFMTLLLILIILSVSSYFLYKLQGQSTHQVGQQLETADRKAVFDALVGGMKEFRREDKR